ncbi:MAG: BlaI/MecI/CopY family transcriptional regulator [Bacteroidota bacterium]
MKKIKLDDLQLKIMKALWQLGEASVSDIQEVLKQEDRTFAITTIGTILQRLYKKQIVSYRKSGRQYIYQPSISEKDVQDSMTSNLVKQLFKGKSSMLVNHLLESEDFDPEELYRLQQMIEEAQQKNND